jgi:imidazolonepropionase-like amidohydrolase
MKRLLAVCLLLAASSCAQTVAIRAGNLIDPATGTVAKNQIILVNDKKIQSVVASGIPKDAKVIDLSNEWVMPGIMDAHTHVTQSVKYFRELDHNYLVESTGLRALRGLRTAQTLLNAGITTVRDVGNDANFAAVDLRKAIDAGWFIGPTVQTA